MIGGNDDVVFDLPMRLKFRGQLRRSGILLRGAAGWAEFSPFPDYDDAKQSLGTLLVEQGQLDKAEPWLRLVAQSGRDAAMADIDGRRRNLDQLQPPWCDHRRHVIFLGCVRR